MQYEITLPADYDMGIVRNRVATRGHLLDGFPGLGFKAYLMRQTPINQYSPFYVWDDTAGMNRFLWGGGGFHNIVADFGRPPVKHWTGVDQERGRATQARFATRVLAPIPADAELTTVADDATAQLKSSVDNDLVCASVLAIDPYHWELLHFTLWEDLPDDTPGDRYEVLYLAS
ncbi:DUF4865 family protein [Actinocrispum sp. NPDC049592]|uniref:DUF4865 family protein n=1 Tax=Actinocrispum sp. NPDC049592 TaxID=3154835 RepID=UPI0034381734